MSKFIRFFDETLEIILEAELTELHQALKQLVLPPMDRYAPEEWQAFHQQVKQLAQEHRDIAHDWDFNREQVKRLENYFAANLLLLDCLNLATVSDREKTKAELVKLSTKSCQHQ